MTEEEKLRNELLLKMYDQMFSDINRHILVVWQSIGVLIGAFAIFALTEKNIISLDIACTLIVLLCGWLLAHLHDASYWYNRNLVIIANIERQFLIQSDLKNIHYYFGAHRPNNKMIMHLKIQYILGLLLGFIVLLYHFLTRMLPCGCEFNIECDIQRFLPYLGVLIVAIIVLWIQENRRLSYEEFLENSPGVHVDISDVRYGVGHGHPDSSKPNVD